MFVEAWKMMTVSFPDQLQEPFHTECMPTRMFISDMSDNTSVDVNHCHDNASYQQKCLERGKDYKSRKGCQAGYLIDFTWDINLLKWKISTPGLLASYSHIHIQIFGEIINNLGK